MKPGEPSAELMAYARAYECPTCSADKTLRWDGRTYHLNVMHDDACPVLAELEKRGLDG